jgi:hypothetical protein
MSTVVSKNVQIGADGTASNNFTIYQPESPDGTLRIGNGNSGTTSAQVVLDSAGNVGIGLANASEQLQTTGNIRAGGQFLAEATDTAAAPGYAWRGDTDTGIFRAGVDAIGFSTSGSERARIDSSGNLLVGTTSTTINSSNFGTRIDAVGNVLLHSRNTTSGVAQFYGSTGENRFIGTGAIQNTLNSYGAISDIKLKENIVDATPKLEKLNQVRIVNFNLIGSEQKQIGVIAQELEQIFPGMVDSNPDEDSEGNDLGTVTKSVKYSVFVPMLIKAMQEQQAIIEQLKADVAALKGAQA